MENARDVESEVEIKKPDLAEQIFRLIEQKRELREGILRSELQALIDAAARPPIIVSHPFPPAPEAPLAEAGVVTQPKPSGASSAARVRGDLDALQRARKEVADLTATELGDGLQHFESWYLSPGDLIPDCIPRLPRLLIGTRLRVIRDGDLWLLYRLDMGSDVAIFSYVPDQAGGPLWHGTNGVKLTADGDDA